MLITSSKLFIWHLSRRIVRIKIAGKGAVIEKTRAVIAGKRINERASFVLNFYAVHEFFLSAEGAVRSFDKSDFKSKKLEEERKKFYKKIIIFMYFFQ